MINLFKRNDKESKEIIAFALSILSAWAVYWCFIPLTISSNDMIYAIGQIHAFDKSIFMSNVYMQEGVISPRLFLDTIICFCMRINGGNWSEVAVLLMIAGGLLFAVAVSVLAHKLTTHYRIFFTLVITLYLMHDIVPQVGGFKASNVVSTIGMGIGYDFVILAIAFVVGKTKKFNYAWMALTLATIFHIHEGLYGFFIVLIMLLVEILKGHRISIKDHWCCIFYFIVLFGTIIPNMLTDSLNIDSEEFVYIYGVFRHPHHLIPTSWSKVDIIYSIMFIVYPACFRIEYLCFNEREKLKSFLIEFALFIISWLGALAVMYFGTERLHIVSITTMFISKYFKYVAIIALIWYVKIVQDYFEKKRYLFGVGVLIFAGAAYLQKIYMPIIFLCGVTYIYYFYRTHKIDEEKEDYIYGLLLVGIYAMTEIFIPRRGTPSKCSVVISIIFGLLLLFETWKHSGKKIYGGATITFSIILTVVCSYGVFYRYSENKVSIVTVQDVFISSMGNDIYQLANNFREQTKPTESYLADPWDENTAAERFQIVSERNCYVIHKVIPSSKVMVKEWYERYQKASGLFDKDINEIIEIMNATDNMYILVDSNNYDKIDTYTAFSLFAQCDTDSYRVYKLIE